MLPNGSGACVCAHYVIIAVCVHVHHFNSLRNSYIKDYLTKWLLVRQEARTQSGCRRLGSETLARSRVRAGYEFVSRRHHPDQRLPAVPIATASS